MREKLKTIGEKLIFLSAIIFSLSLPTSIALDNVAAGIGILGLLIYLFSKAQLSLPPIKPLLFFTIPEFISSLFNIEMLRKLTKYTDINHHLIPYFVSFKAFLKENSNSLLTLLSISTIFSSLILAFEAFTHQNIRHFNIHALHLFSSPIRPRGFLNNPLTEAGVLYLLFLLFTFLSFKENRKLYPLTAVLSLIGIILTQSRSYWLGCGLFFFLLFFYSLKKHKKISITIALFSLLSIGLVTTIPLLKHRLESIDNVKTNTSNMDRLTIWNSYLKAFKYEYSPLQLLIGAGEKGKQLAAKHFEESFKEIYKRTEPRKEELIHFHGGETHNIYLKFLAKYGILGLLGYLLFWVYIIYRNLKFSKILPSLSILSFGYLGFMLAGFFENNFTDAEVQFTLFFLLGFNFAVIKKLKDKLPSVQ